MQWLKNLMGAKGQTPDPAAESVAPEPALADLSLEVLVSENLRLGAMIDELRERRLALRPLIEQKILERERSAPSGPGSAVLKAGG